MDLINQINIIIAILKMNKKNAPIKFDYKNYLPKYSMVHIYPEQRNGFPHVN